MNKVSETDHAKCKPLARQRVPGVPNVPTVYGVLVSKIGTPRMMD
jgi:hypothetical protein